MNIEYTQEELELLESIENGDWKSIKGIEEEKERYQRYASQYVKER